jgi:hypothetical protein
VQVQARRTGTFLEEHQEHRRRAVRESDRAAGDRGPRHRKRRARCRGTGTKIVTDKAQADAYLEGAVTDFTTPVQFSSAGRATRLETTVVLRASSGSFDG